MTTVFDCAGARRGGAKRLLDELELYLAHQERTDLRLVGHGRALTAPWLVRRESAASGARRTVALNNVCFQMAGRSRVVLARNALHYLRPDEEADLGRLLPPRLHLQARVVRGTLRRADRVVVPATSMGDRVVSLVPEVVDRIVVRPHPVSPPTRAHRVAATATAGPAADIETPATFVCPVIWQPYKRMVGRLSVLLAAADLLARAPYRVETVIAVTAAATELGGSPLGRHPRLRLLGPRIAAEVTEMMLTCAGVVYPTEIESFGYPMAESRILGTPVVARDTAHNREVAGDALVPYARQAPEDLAAALYAAIYARPGPADPSVFDRDSYFTALVG